MSFLIGLDLGQTTDPTAIAILERDQHEDAPATYQCRHLERLRLGTTYPDVVRHMKALVSRPQLQQVIHSVGRRRAYGGVGWATEQTVVTPQLIVDATGVGRPVVDMLKDAGLEPIAITITGGDAVTFDAGWRVPKRDIVATMQVLLQSDRLKIASTLQFAPTLQEELLRFRVKIDPLTAHDSYGVWREGGHDDLVLACAIACWIGERGLMRRRDFSPEAWGLARRYVGRLI